MITSHLFPAVNLDPDDVRPPFATMQSMIAEAATVPVNLESGRYDIVIRPGMLADVGSILATLTRSQKAAIITDSQVGPLFAQPLIQSLIGAGIEPVVATIPAGEAHKTLTDLSDVYDVFLAHRMERTTPVIALGGGVIGDMAGFVAATILRGVPFVQVPTTLLAMVDASVGGKTGINHAAGKNLIGAFHQPIAVLIDPQTLRTLPDRELHGGLAECIKHEVIRDADGFAELEQHISRALSLEIDYLSMLVAHNVSIKARVVEADPFERGERAHLNFGHTFGHAIETVSQYGYSHGQCVALGMVAASRMARDLELLDESSCQRIIGLIDKAGLPIGGITLPAKDVVEAMTTDKKVSRGRVRFILPDRIGHVIIRDDIANEMVIRAVESLWG